MPWLFLLLAVAALGLALLSASITLVVACLLATLVLLGLWFLGLMARRIDRHSRDHSQMLDPGELQRLRALAQARRSRHATDTGTEMTPGAGSADGRRVS